MKLHNLNGKSLKTKVWQNIDLQLAFTLFKFDEDLPSGGISDGGSGTPCVVGWLGVSVTGGGAGLAEGGGAGDSCDCCAACGPGGGIGAIGDPDIG